MGCIEREVLEDFVDGELGQCETARAIEHIRSCARCRREFAEIFALHEGLHAAVAEDTCPSRATLEAHAKDALSSEEGATVRKHLEFCSACRSYVWLLTASESELANWQTQEEQAHKQYEATIVGRDAVHEVLAGLVPAGLEFLDRLWNSAQALVQDLRTKEPGQWPRLGASGQLVGVLGFAGPADPEKAATAVILLSTLFVAERISGGEIGTSMDEIATAVREAAQAFGAGKELQKRLVETVPPVLRRFYGLSDARPSA